MFIQPYQFIKSVTNQFCLWQNYTGFFQFKCLYSLCGEWLVEAGWGLTAPKRTTCVCVCVQQGVVSLTLWVLFFLMVWHLSQCPSAQNLELSSWLSCKTKLWLLLCLTLAVPVELVKIMRAGAHEVFVLLLPISDSLSSLWYSNTSSCEQASKLTEIKSHSCDLLWDLCTLVWKKLNKIWFQCMENKRMVKWSNYHVMLKFFRGTKREVCLCKLEHQLFNFIFSYFSLYLKNVRSIK